MSPDGDACAVPSAAPHARPTAGLIAASHRCSPMAPGGGPAGRSPAERRPQQPGSTPGQHAVGGGACP